MKPEEIADRAIKNAEGARGPQPIVATRVYVLNAEPSTHSMIRRILKRGGIQSSNGSGYGAYGTELILAAGSFVDVMLALENAGVDHKVRVEDPAEDTLPVLIDPTTGNIVSPV